MTLGQMTFNINGGRVVAAPQPGNACARCFGTTGSLVSRRGATLVIAAHARCGWMACRCIPAWCRHSEQRGAP